MISSVVATWLDPDSDEEFMDASKVFRGIWRAVFGRSDQDGSLSPISQSSDSSVSLSTEFEERVSPVFPPKRSVPKQSRPAAFSPRPMPVDPVFSGNFYRSNECHRDFLLEVAVKGNVYPIVFDTGSANMWVTSEHHAKDAKHIRTQLPLPISPRGKFNGRPFMAYIGGTGVFCEAWYETVAHTALDFVNTSWRQLVCVADRSSLSLGGFLGVMGADRTSYFVQKYPVFWITALDHNVSLIVHFSPSIDTVICNGPLVSTPLTSRPGTENHWEFQAEVVVEGVSFHVHVSPDTGVHGLFVHDALWEKLHFVWTQLGFEVSNAGKNSNTRMFSKTACNRIKELPDIIFHIAEFIYILKGPQYAFPGGDRCYFDVGKLPASDDDLILIGANMLTKINTRFDSTEDTISFCHPIHSSV